MEIHVPITQRSRRFGYLYWPKAQDEQMHTLLGQDEYIEVTFNHIEVGAKRIDWKYRRISIGPSKFRSLPENVETVVLRLDNKDRLEVSTE